MNYLIFTITAVTLLVVLSYSVELLADTYDREMEKRMDELQRLDELFYYGN